MSNVSASYGKDSALPSRTSTAGNRARQASTKGSDGSMADTFADPRSATRCWVNAPGPQPTSRALSPGETPSQSVRLAARGRE